MIGDIMAGIGSIGNMIGSTVLGSKSYQLQKQAHNDYMDIAKQNLGFQREQYDYSKNLQSQIFDREDNATQRRVADLKAAGLNPVLAAGSAAGAGSVVSTTAPQMDAGASQYKSKAGDTLQSMGSNFGESMTVANQLLNFMNQREIISKTSAERNLVNLQALKTAADTDVSKQQKFNLLKQIEHIGSQIALNNANVENVLSGTSLNRLKLDVGRSDFQLFKKRKSASTDVWDVNRMIMNQGANLLDKIQNKSKFKGTPRKQPPSIKQQINDIYNSPDYTPGD